MHAHFLDPYRDGASPVHRLDPRVKLTLAVAFIVTAALLPPAAWPAYVLLFAAAFSVVLASGLGVGYVYKRALLAAPFVLAALPLLFTVDGAALLTLHLGPWTLTLTDAGLARFVSIAFKSWLSVDRHRPRDDHGVPRLAGRDARAEAAAAAGRGGWADVALSVRPGG